MLETLLGSATREKVLMFLYVRNEGYAREIARYFETGLTPIQKQLERLEYGNILFSRKAGRTRLYAINPRYPFLSELRALLEKAVAFLDPADKERLTMNRRRPRRKDKPL